MSNDESERLYHELRELEGTLPQIEAEEQAAIEDPELQGLVVRLLTMDKILEVNDKRAQAVRSEISKRRKVILAAREVYRIEYGRLAGELQGLTGPIIKEIVQGLTELMLRPKLNREIVSKKYDGFREKTILTVLSNEKAITEIRAIAKKAIEKIQGMAFSPISEIRAEFSEARGGIERIDWKKTERIEGVDEAQFLKFSFPKDVVPGYSGPLSGLR